MISRFFTFDEHATLLEGAYHFPLVVLSLLVAMFASFMAFNVAEQAAITKDNLRRNILLGTGSVALGGGIWSMHFLGMTAFELCTPVSYSATLTGLSALPGVAAAWVALYLLTKSRISAGEILLGGVLVGSGIGTMHYSGMAAMEMAPLLRYDLPMFALSIVVAVLLAMLALWIKFGIKKATRSNNFLGKHLVLASVVMGGAISGMHYTGMAAARFVLPPGMETSTQSSGIAVFLAVSIALVTLTLITMVLGVSLLFKYRDVMVRAIESERVQRAITDTAIDAILTVDDKGIIKTANPAVEDIYGFTPDELVGQHASVVIPHEKRYLYGDDFFSQRVVPTEQVIGTGREAEILRKNGEKIPVRVGVGATKLDGKTVFVSFVSDLRKRKEMENALRESEAKFRSLISNIPGVAYRCLVNPDWPMVFISDAVTEITGYPPQDFVLPSPKRSFSELYHPDDVEIFSNIDSDAGAFSFEYRIIAKSGEVKWVTEHGVHVKDDNGNVLYMDGFISDITHRRLMEEELKAAKEKAELAAATRAAFLANMSHEIRTPMNAIIGFSDLMLGEELLDEQKSHLTTINRSARSLLHLLNDILDSAKLDKGKLELDYRDFLIREELDLVVSTFWLEAKRKKVELILNVDEHVATCYRGVPERIRQVLNNLIGNAVKFTHQGKVVINVKSDEDFVCFDVVDTGIGMTKEQLDRVFDPFSQADASMSRKYGGTGLGTTISKQLVELMGGTICAKSEENKGSTFSFKLPLEATVFSENSVPAGSEKTTYLDVTLKVLVVDDVLQNTELLTLLLTRSGHMVETASNGVEALEKMREQAFDIVLMDLQMPKMDGLEAAKQRRLFEKEQGLPATPIIALTASVLVQDKHAAQQAGMEGFANKPVDFSSLMDEMARVLNVKSRKTSVHSKEPSQGNSVSTLVAEKNIIDINKAIELWGSEEVVLRELDKFTSSCRDQINELMNTAIREDYATVTTQAHRLKGTSGNLGLTTFFRIASEIESQALKSTVNIDDITGLREALDKIELMLSESPLYAEDVINEIIDNELILEHLKTLLTSVEQNMVNEEELVVLREAVRTTYNNEVSQILLDIDDFEFELAQKGIRALIEKLK